jgi:hypothetical protein
MLLTLDKYVSFWKKAKENTSCYPDALSFATLKVGSKSSIISEMECTLTRIPLDDVFTP